MERKQRETELDPQDLQKIVNYWNPALARRNIKERFEKGASLWLIKYKGRLAGFTWSLRGRTLQPYFFPLGPHDVHMFDFQVFPQYRGEGMSPSLMTYIWRILAGEGAVRLFGEVAEWNHAQLAFLRKTPFHRLGQARKFTIFDRTVVFWDENETLKQKGESKNLSLAAAARGGS